MTAAGEQKLPDLSLGFEVPSDILAQISLDSEAKRHFDSFPELYVRIRVGYIIEMRNRPDEFARRLSNFLTKTAAGKMFGNWNDGGRLL